MLYHSANIYQPVQQPKRIARNIALLSIRRQIFLQRAVLLESRYHPFPTGQFSASQSSVHRIATYLHVIVIATVASLAMKIILTPTDSAYPTTVTVELLLCGVIVKEITFQAKILPKGHSTRPAGPRNRLAIPTQLADDLLDGLAIKGMSLLGILSKEKRDLKTCGGLST